MAYNSFLHFALVLTVLFYIICSQNNVFKKTRVRAASSYVFEGRKFAVPFYSVQDCCNVQFHLYRQLK